MEEHQHGQGVDDPHDEGDGFAHEGEQAGASQGHHRGRGAAGPLGGDKPKIEINFLLI